MFAPYPPAVEPDLVLRTLADDAFVRHLQHAPAAVAIE
jgi:hypothetical protein